MNTKIQVDNGWLDHLLAQKLAQWNERADVVGRRAFRGDMEHHGIHAVWIKSELQELLALYNSMATLVEAGASFPKEEKS